MNKYFEAAKENNYFTLPVSEYLIQEVSTYISSNKVRTLFDIGTGSGSLAITIGLAHPDITIKAFDISEDALQEARNNVNIHTCNNIIECLQGNYVDQVEPTLCPDLIMASLPYGNEDYLTDGNTMESLSKYPSISYFHPSGKPLGCYCEMIESILSKKWKTTAIIETGNIPDDIIAESFDPYTTLSREKLSDTVTTLYFL